MTLRIGVVMDPIASIKPAKDTTFAMLLEAQARQWPLFYIEMDDLWIASGSPYARTRRLRVVDQAKEWFSFGEEESLPLRDLDVILMRKDPPFDMEYVYATYILQRAEDEGVLVINKPQSLREANEKMFISWFSHCCVPTLVTRSAAYIRAFLAEHHHIVLKPLDGMGGRSIFSIKERDPNTAVCIETLTQNGQRYTMAQRYIPESKDGDKRIILIDGEPIPYALARIPQGDDFRGNLAVGGRGEARPLTERDRWITEQVGPVLREKGLLFVGLDVLGDYLTEINVTSPTGVREIDKAYKISICARLMDVIEEKRKEKPKPPFLPPPSLRTSPLSDTPPSLASTPEPAKGA